MGINGSLTSGLDAFAERFRALTEAGGLPGSEDEIHHCLASGLQEAWALSPGAVVFEHPFGSRSRIDLWVREPRDMAIEVKYVRVPSVSAPVFPMNYGQVLADFNKIAPNAVQTPTNRGCGR